MWMLAVFIVDPICIVNQCMISRYNALLKTCGLDATFRNQASEAISVSKLGVRGNILKSGARFQTININIYWFI